MNTFKLDQSGNIVFACFDNKNPDEWFEVKEDGRRVKTDRRVVETADGRLHFADEITEAEIEQIAESVALAEKWESLRAARNARIAETDYMLLPDVEISDERRARVLAYRQALRDLPAQDGAPWDGASGIPWPVLEQ